MCERLEPRRLLTAAPVGVALDTHFGTAGTAITALVPGAYVDSWASGATVAPDGKLLVTGYQQFLGVNAKRDAVVERYDPVTGAPDPTFGQGGTARLHRDGYDLIAQQTFVQSDGRVLAVINASYSIASSSYTTGILARFNADGTLDRSFGNRGTVDVNSRSGISALQLPGDQILVSGGTTGGSGNTIAAIWRYNADGTLDTTFGTGGMRTYTQNGNAVVGIASLVLMPDGSFAGVTTFSVNRYNADGSVRWSAGYPIGSGAPTSITATPDGNLVALMPNRGASYDVNLQRYNGADGSLDPTFGSGGVVQLDVPNASVSTTSVVVQPDGRIVLGGQSGDLQYQQYALIRLLPTGQVDATFNDGGVRTDSVAGQVGSAGELHAIVLSPDGRSLYAVGVTRVPPPGTPTPLNSTYNLATIRYAIDPGIVVDANGPSTPVGEGTTFPVSAVGSSYANGTIDLYEWGADFAFPAGAVTGITAQLTAVNGPGARPVVRVTTSDGLQAIAPVNVTEVNVAPTISLPGGPGPYLAAQRASFYFSTIVNDAGGDAATVTIDWGDGSAPASGAVSGSYRYLNASHAYANRGTYTIRVDAVDADGAPAQELTTTMNVVQGVGTVVNDQDDSGFISGGETGYAGATVYLDANNNGQLDAGELQTTTDANGRYGFDALPAGTYNVRVVLPAGYHVSSPRGGAAAVGTVSATTGFSTDLAITPQADVTGVIFRDDNGNGVRNAGETQSVQTTVYADLNDNGKLDAGEPNTFLSFGQTYTLGNLPAGTYPIRFVDVAGYVRTAPAGGAVTVTIAAGQALGAPDAGYQPSTSSIGGVVYNDADMSGTQSTGEVGLSGVTVYIDANKDGQLDNGEQATTSDVNGNYRLYGLTTGTYVVRVVPPAGWNQTAPAAGAAITRTLTLNQTTSADNFGVAATAAVPVAPTNVTTTVLNPWHIRVSWTPATIGAAPDGYVVLRKLPSGPYSVIGTLGPDATSFDDNLPKATPASYTYAIQAHAGTYYSTLSKSVTQFTTVAFNGPSSNSLFVRRDANNNTLIDFWLNSATPGQGTPDGQQPVSGQTFSIVGGPADDVVTVDFSNGNPLASGSLTFDGGGGNNVFRLVGSAGDDTVIADAGGYVNFSNASASLSFQTKNIQLVGFAGGSGGNDTLNVRYGNWTIDADAPAGVTPNVSVAVQDLATATFISDQRLAGLSVCGGSVSLGSAAMVSLSGPLTMTRGSTLDLGRGTLLAPTSPDLGAYVAQAAGSVQPSGLNAWTGTGLTSSVVQADAANGNAKQLVLGFFDSRDNDQTGLSVPDGQTLVKVTVYGDATGDGKVSIADLSVWNNNFGASNPRWSQGDFNYDGKVNIADLSVWNNDFGNNVATILGASPPALAAATAMTSPEVAPVAADAETSPPPSQAPMSTAQVVPMASVIPIVPTATVGANPEPHYRRRLVPWRRVARQRRAAALETTPPTTKRHHAG